MNANSRRKTNANETNNPVSNASDVAKRIVAPSPEPSRAGDGKDLFRWAVRKGLINQQAPDKNDSSGL
jgi:hypothetical protein